MVQAVDESESKRSIRALVVEDNDALRRKVARAVSGWGGEVAQASTVAEAVSLLASPVDLLIADVCLPDGTSHLLFALAGRMSPVPAMVAISGKSSSSESFTLGKMGVHAFVQKPCSLAEIEHAARSALQAREQRQELAREQLRLTPSSFSQRLDVEIERLAREHRLNLQQRDIVRLSLSGVSRDELAETLGVSENTCKSAVRRLVRRCGVSRLAEVTQQVLARARSTE